ncbi:MAG: radical SAM protein [Deltaproteobacteria bacterium]|jgi:radical SAM protein with 4Fe4S-binding SPASM domain|nr:radical SAM protein [Deltaproteobacteria bacterium]
MSRRLFRELKAPLRAFIEVTGNCNLGCKHCYNYWRDLGNQLDCSTAKHMTEKLAERVIGQIIDNEVFSVCLSGGEPLTNYNVVKLILKRCHGTKNKVTMNSNVTLLTEQRLDELMSLGLSAIYTTVLGSSPFIHDTITGVVGSFERTILGIELCHRKGMPISTNTVVTKRNINDIFATAEMLKRIGCESMSIDIASCPFNCSDFSDYALGRDEQIKLLNDIAIIDNTMGIKARKATPIPYCVFPELDDFSKCLDSNCTAGTFSCTIGSDGQLRACPLTANNVGSIVKYDLLTLWEKFTEWRTDEFIPDSCRDCKLLYRCGARCRLGGHQVTSQMDCANLLMNADSAELAYELLKMHNQKTFRQMQMSGQITFSDFVLRLEKFGAVVWDGFQLQLIDAKGVKIFQTLTPKATYNVDEIMFPGYESFFRDLITSGLATIN